MEIRTFDAAVREGDSCLMCKTRGCIDHKYTGYLQREMLRTSGSAQVPDVRASLRVGCCVC